MCSLWQISWKLDRSTAKLFASCRILATTAPLIHKNMLSFGEVEMPSHSDYLCWEEAISSWSTRFSRVTFSRLSWSLRPCLARSDKKQGRNIKSLAGKFQDAQKTPPYATQQIRVAQSIWQVWSRLIKYVLKAFNGKTKWRECRSKPVTQRRRLSIECHLHNRPFASRGLHKHLQEALLENDYTYSSNIQYSVCIVTNLEYLVPASSTAAWHGRRMAYFLVQCTRATQLQQHTPQASSLVFSASSGGSSWSNGIEEVEAEVKTSDAVRLLTFRQTAFEARSALFSLTGTGCNFAAITHLKHLHPGVKHIMSWHHQWHHPKFATREAAPEGGSAAPTETLGTATHAGSGSIPGCVRNKCKSRYSQALKSYRFLFFSSK